jgi:large subunit ribosomal protein L17
MATSLILHKRIKTTVAKAKELRMFIEPIITRSKEDTTHSRRLAFGYLQDKNAVAELFREVSPRVLERPGGYTRILKLGTRVGDAAEMCYIELVDFNETMVAAKTAEESRTTRRGRRGSKKKSESRGAGAVKAETETEKAVVPETEEPDASQVDKPVRTEQPADEKAATPHTETEAESESDTEAAKPEDGEPPDQKIEESSESENPEEAKENDKE